MVHANFIFVSFEINCNIRCKIEVVENKKSSLIYKVVSWLIWAVKILMDN